MTQFLKVIVGTSFLMLVACGQAQDSKKAAEPTPKTSTDATPAGTTAQTSNQVSSIAAHGTWLAGEINQDLDDGLKLIAATYFVISEGKVKVITKCSVSNGLKAEVQVEGKALVTANKIEILEDKKDSVKQNGLSCSASVLKMTSTYTVSGDSLNYTSSDGRTAKMKKASL